MIPFAVSSGYIKSEELVLFKKMRDVMEGIDNPPFVMSCHHICHALERIFPKVCAVDGFFGKGGKFEHGWLTFKRKKEEDIVICDMYPVGGASSLLIHAHHTLDWFKLYKPFPKVLDIVKERDVFYRVNEQESFANCVFVVEKLIREWLSV